MGDSRDPHGCLNVITPGAPVGGLPYAQWLTLAMCAFCLLNACYVTVITSMVLAREEGILKRLRGTPCPPGPTWPTGPAPPL